MERTLLPSHQTLVTFRHQPEPKRIFSFSSTSFRLLN